MKQAASPECCRRPGSASSALPWCCKLRRESYSEKERSRLGCHSGAKLALLLASAWVSMAQGLGLIASLFRRRRRIGPYSARIIRGNSGQYQANPALFICPSGQFGFTRWSVSSVLPGGQFGLTKGGQFQVHPFIHGC
eukprot:734332-Pleurochrysis_carterae.AAC.2